MGSHAAWESTLEENDCGLFRAFLLTNLLRIEMEKDLNSARIRKRRPNQFLCGETLQHLEVGHPTNYHLMSSEHTFRLPSTSSTRTF